MKAANCDQGWDVVKKLTRAYSDGYGKFRSKSYDEAKLRQGFIDPLFEALGWDVEGSSRSIGHDVEVVFEDRDGTNKRPDYGFYTASKLQFYVEVKKPSVKISDREFIYQAKEYAWNAKAPFCLLTNFERISAVSGNLVPVFEEPLVGIIDALNIEWESYADRWLFMWSLLSRDAVAAGSIDRLVKGVKSTRNSSSVDAAFLASLERWRTLVAQEIVRSNAFRQGNVVTEHVERIIDRIVFIRVCEDRGITNGKPLLETWRAWSKDPSARLYACLCKIFKTMAAQFNGSLFAPHASERLIVSDDRMAAILKELYEGSAYRFDIIPVEILGSIYERFLGNTITVGQNCAIAIESKPEVRHARGVFYTPSFVVKTIVSSTLKHLTNGVDPSGLLALRIVDPACGSGSFLLETFQHLIDCHLAWYEAHPKARTETHVYEHNGILKITLKRKKEILEKCIFGVDKDPQAVEVARMSLYLKMLEAESEQSIARKETIEMFKADKYLPALEKNVVCGNSVVSPQDIKKVCSGAAIDELLVELNAFDWSSASDGFGNIMSQGGFDAVVGNPPYVRIQEMKKWAHNETEVMKRSSAAASGNSFDLYVIFIAKSLSLIKPRGRVGFIVPHRFFTAKYGQKLRTILQAADVVDEIVDFGHWQVFGGVTTYTCLLFLSRGDHDFVKLRKVKPSADALNIALAQTIAAPYECVPRQSLSAHAWHFRGGGGHLLDQLLDQHPSLETIVHRVFQGLISGRDAVFFLTLQAGKIYSSALEAVVDIEDELLHDLLKGSVHVRKYVPHRPTLKALFPYANGTLLTPQALEEQFPRAWAYLNRCRPYLASRENGAWESRADWYAYGRSQALKTVMLPKILTPSLAASSAFLLDAAGDYFFCGSGQGGGGGYAITLKSAAPCDLAGLAAYLNSSLVAWCVRKISQPYRGGYWSYNKDILVHLPLVTAARDHVPEGFAAIGELHQRNCILANRLSSAEADHEISKLKRAIASNEREIDAMVFFWAGIAPEDQIAMVQEVSGLRDT